VHECCVKKERKEKKEKRKKDVMCDQTGTEQSCARMLCALRGGEDSKDALSCRSFSANEVLTIGLFCRK